jgi:hypothetical protein
MAPHLDSETAYLIELFAQWQIKNQNTALYFGAAILGLIAVFTTIHWTEVIFDKLCSRSSSLRLNVRSITRRVSQICRVRHIGGLQVRPGRYMLSTLYFAINIILTFHDNPLGVTALGIFAKRLGW